MVKEADEKAPDGVDHEFYKSLRLHGNTCKTELEITQKNHVRAFSRSSVKFALAAKAVMKRNQRGASFLENQGMMDLGGQSATFKPGENRKKRSKSPLGGLNNSETQFKFQQEEIVNVDIKVKSIEFEQN